jgi:mono/diheme cytochrome c family protein
VFKGGVEAQTPVKGSVKRGFVPYEIPNTPEGYAIAKASLKSPLDSLSLNAEKGKELFNIYCTICHGEKGGNDGKVSAKQSVLKPSWANYQDPYIQNLPVGNIYHVLTYGKNNMGSYAYALTPRERWAVISFVKRLSAMDAEGNIPNNVSVTPIISSTDTLTQK